MAEEKFQTWITNGLGRAILWLRAHPWQPHAEAIAHVCLHNTDYDPQCGGSRAEYVREAVNLTGARDHFAGITVNALLNTGQQYWDADHTFHLTRLFAQDGYAPAREALYAKFGRNDSEERFLGGDQIVALDGIHGLLFVLDRIGAHLIDHPDYWVDDWLLREAEEKSGSDAVARALREAAAENVNVGRYMEGVEEYRARKIVNRSPEYRSFTWCELRNRINSGDVPLGWLLGWGRHASEGELKQAAIDLNSEQDQRRLLACLRVFLRRAFRIGPERLIQLAEADDREIAKAAVRALRHLHDDSVRAAALRRLSRPDADSDDLQLLVENYTVGDEQLIESLLDRSSDDDALHWIGYAALHVYKHNADADTGPSMLKLYERGRCGNCRLGAVKLLLKQNKATGQMLSECRYDSNPSVREAVMGAAERE